MRLLKSKLTYLIILLLIVNIVLVLVIVHNNENAYQTMSVDFFVSGNSQNMSCISVHIDDDNTDHKYSFDNGKSWQNSNYGALYENGTTSILVRNNYGKVIFEKEISINYLVDDGPIIKMNFDKNVSSKSEKQYLNGVKATSNEQDISSNIKISILENHQDNVLVSYLVEDNGKICNLLRNISIGDNSETTSDQWLWPTDKTYKISRLYGKYNGKLHNGIDIYNLKRGSSIYAARAGEVVAITSNSSSGFYVTIKHDNGYYTRYAHLQNTKGNDSLKGTNSAKKYISVGDYVKAGDVIGEIGSTGNSTGLHLHFEIWDGPPYSSKSYDPLKFY